VLIHFLDYCEHASTSLRAFSNPTNAHLTSHGSMYTALSVDYREQEISSLQAIPKQVNHPTNNLDHKLSWKFSVIWWFTNWIMTKWNWLNKSTQYEWLQEETKLNLNFHSSQKQLNYFHITTTQNRNGNKMVKITTKLWNEFPFSQILLHVFRWRDFSLNILYNSYNNKVKLWYMQITEAIYISS